ncbi:hypothetical protein EJ04DRAFT_517063 [Polyplosphaeria fusca]|uniref:N-acetyltransferase domain-containing protein n=1 Tax=Polyplosphaeria fusca TaxID=682080 RepID=A0A9P4UWF8_9PLEO|nr:hypothetical protein EJ04DRAFT_517063 [Polyplosphaeria fusca]
MPLQILPMEEADFPGLVNILFSAFSTGMTHKLAKRPLTPEYVQSSIDKHVKCFRTEPDCHYLKVVDTDLNGKMISCAKWRINEQELTEAQAKRMLPEPGEDEEGNLAAQDFMRYLARVRAEYMGRKPFYLLHILVTDPQHQGRGAGAMLIKWGFEGADKAKLKAMLESTESGKPLYTKLGFYDVHKETFDLAKYGGNGLDYSTVMFRDPA